MISPGSCNHCKQTIIPVIKPELFAANHLTELIAVCLKYYNWYIYIYKYRIVFLLLGWVGSREPLSGGFSILK